MRDGTALEWGFTMSRQAWWRNREAILAADFEQNLLTALVSRPRTGRAGDAEDQQPRARNHVNELMRIVGVQGRTNNLEI